ncbi:MAG: permease [Candidatus Eiseniibacteriota bacterium]|nr:MAG: permease [Candidatus Eisenbacteria bacterium]
MEKAIQILLQFGRLSFEIIPYFLVGTMAGALLKSWLPFSIVERYLRPGVKSIVAVSLFGGVVPVCSCSMVPLAQTMKEKGAALGAIVAFLIVAPVLSPVTVFLTWGWLGPGFTVARIVAAFAGALVVGTVMQRVGVYPAANGPGAAPTDCTETDSCKETDACGCEKVPAPEADLKSAVRLYWSNMVMILGDLWGYLLIGIAVSAVLSVLVPPELIPSLVGTGVRAHLVAAVVGVPIYVCSGEEVPIAKALLDINLTPGATFTFLLSSTGICLPTILMASKFLGRKNAALYALFWFILAVGAGLLFSAVA